MPDFFCGRPLATAGSVVVATLVMSGCASNPRTPEPVYTDFPDAPSHKFAPLTSGTDAVVDPVAELADSTWVSRTAQSTGIPQRAVSAYAGASLRVRHDNPKCAIGWNAIAGIGAVESAHGSYGGASIDSRGNVSPHIRGIALDGSEGVMAIEDTDGGELDGDKKWDRAVGPMQFIPSTWQVLGQDGNGDGVRDPHQIDDAALATAVHLCEGAVKEGEQGNLAENSNWHSAVYSYNKSKKYAHQVTDFANRYVDEGVS